MSALRTSRKRAVHVFRSKVCFTEVAKNALLRKVLFNKIRPSTWSFWKYCKAFFLYSSECNLRKMIRLDYDNVFFSFGKIRLFYSTFFIELCYQKTYVWISLHQSLILSQNADHFCCKYKLLWFMSLAWECNKVIFPSACKFFNISNNFCSQMFSWFRYHRRIKAQFR